MDDAPVLYSFRRCPFAMRARMAIAVSGQKVRLREILLKDKPADMLAVSGKGTVPVLVLDDGRVIDESLDVMDWALGAADPEDWRGPDGAAQRALIADCDGPFKGHLDRYKYATRYDDADPLAHRAAGTAFLEDLDARIERHGGHLFREGRALADIAIFPFVRQFRIADPDWFDDAAPDGLKGWLRGLMDSALFTSVMSKYALWQSGETGVMFP